MSLAEYDVALEHTRSLYEDLTDGQLFWRPHENSSAIAWHLGHQAAVNHYMLRNLIAAEPSINTAYEAVFDSATPEPERSDLPERADIVAYRDAVATRTHAVYSEQFAPVLTAIISHEYQHSGWIAEVRRALA